MISKDIEMGENDPGNEKREANIPDEEEVEALPDINLYTASNHVLDLNNTNLPVISEQHSHNTTHTLWKWCGEHIPKEEIVFFTQVLLIYIVLICCIVNLSLGHGDDKTWTILLGSCLGYLLPNPSLSKKNNH